MKYPIREYIKALIILPIMLLASIIDAIIYHLRAKQEDLKELTNTKRNSGLHRSRATLDRKVN